MNNKKWNNYFEHIENKYDLKINKNNPIVIFLDGKNITKSFEYNLLLEDKNSFNDILEQTVKYFTIVYDCMAISGVDEVSFIFQDTNKLKNIAKKYKTHELISIFSQQFFRYFNNRYSKGSVYWHCKCSNIPKGKVNSYIKHRSLQIFELETTYFLKRKKIKDAGKISLKEKEQICKKMEYYNKIQKNVHGRLYLKGEQINLEEYMNGKITKITENKRKESITFLDLKNL